MSELRENPGFSKSRVLKTLFFGLNTGALVSGALAQPLLFARRIERYPPAKGRANGLEEGK